MVAVAHPDDEVGVAGSVLAQRHRGDRVVILWLTRGEMTEAFGSVPVEEVAGRREGQGAAAAELLGVDYRFLDLPDTALAATPETARRVARVIAEERPDGVVTWGDAWLRGLRHPDHQACGKIVRDAVTLARIRKVVQPEEPHRRPVPVFAIRDEHSRLPAAVVDVEPHLDRVLELGSFYMERVGFGDPEWLEERLATTGRRWGLRYAEAFDAWETRPGIFESLLPAEPAGPPPPPDRPV